MTATYAGKPIDKLSDAALSRAETDVANCLTRVNAALTVSPDAAAYQTYQASLTAQSDAIAAEKQRRGV